MAKFGYLFLNGGYWKDKRIISPKWVNKSTQGHSLDGAYGYLWWLRTYQIGPRRIESYHAGGWGGQFIIVARELDMVVVFTGGNFNTDGDTPVFSRVESYILPAAL
jgi:CubicO group peptidase (beta-lactamase class C family)